VFADIESARDLFDYTADTATRLDVVLPSLAGVDSAAARIDATLGYPHHARTAYEIFRQYFAWVRLQENIIPLVIGVIVLVGAFNIVGTLLMIMLEKTSEIGILGSMGASRSMIRRLFLFLGLLIGGAGIVAGQLLALALSVIQKRYALIPLPKEAYYMDAAPISLVAWDFLLVAALALVLCAAAAYIPAGVSARIEPIRAIRFR
jgi:lipoprotein-releasing system permease protein